MGLLDGLLKTPGDPAKNANADTLTSYEPRIKKINDLEAAIEDLSDEELRQGSVAEGWFNILYSASAFFSPL